MKKFSQVWYIAQQAWYFFFILFLTVFSINAYGQDSLRCLTYGNPPLVPATLDQIGYYLNGQVQEYNGCQSTPAIIIALWGPSCAPIDNCGQYFGQANVYNPASGSCTIGTAGSGLCRNRREKYFIFRFNDQSQMTGMRQMLNQLPNDSFILAYTWYTYAYSIDTTFTNAFASLGATAINTIPDSVPYIFFGKKGNVSSIIELVGSTINDTLVLNTLIACGASGIEDLRENNFGVYPNPVIDYITLSSNEHKIKWEIIDLLGKIVSNGITENKKIDLKELHSGYYFLRMVSEKSLFVFSIYKI